MFEDLFSADLSCLHLRTSLKCKVKFAFKSSKEKLQSPTVLSGPNDAHSAHVYSIIKRGKDFAIFVKCSEYFLRPSF